MPDGSENNPPPTRPIAIYIRMLIPTRARLRLMELTLLRRHGGVSTGWRASSGNSPRCAASCCTHHGQSRFPRENPASLRPQLEQFATVKVYHNGQRRASSHPGSSSYVTWSGSGLKHSVVG